MTREEKKLTGETLRNVVNSCLDRDGWGGSSGVPDSYHQNAAANAVYAMTKLGFRVNKHHREQVSHIIKDWK